MPLPPQNTDLCLVHRVPRTVVTQPTGSIIVSVGIRPWCGFGLNRYRGEPQPYTMTGEAWWTMGPVPRILISQQLAAKTSRHLRSGRGLWCVYSEFLLVWFTLPNPTLHTRHLLSIAFEKEEDRGTDTPPSKEAEVFHSYTPICRPTFHRAWVKGFLGMHSHRNSARETQPEPDVNHNRVAPCSPNIYSLRDPGETIVWWTLRILARAQNLWF